MGIKCGIVGLPNVGKSTLFNALTKAGIEAANYPFCTIEPNLGMVTIPDPRLDALNDIVKPQRCLATTMEFVDIAGLVEGAAKGEGLGNQFLANIRETDAIVHVVRCFDNSNVIHVAGRVDPLSDVAVINTELALADLETVDKALIKANKNSKSGSKDALIEKQLLEKISETLNQGQAIRNMALSSEEQLSIKRFCFLTAKPVLYVANVDDQGYENNPFLDKVSEMAHNEGSQVVAISAATESELIDLSDEEREAFMAELGLPEPGLNRLIRASYALLGLQTYFTAGVKEVRAWTVRKGACAPEAAGVIHTDFEKGFIRAEVIAYEDFIQYGGEQGAKEAGKLRLEGKEYILHDGDVMHFRFNV